jgi:polyhydroxyalkanoate synthase subunit PhaC
MVRGNELASGTVHFEGRDISFADITAPVLAFGGAGDTIAPVSSVRPIEDLVTGARQMRFEVVPGGHLGMLTGRAARETTWSILDEFLDEHASDVAVKPRKRAARARKEPTPATGTTKSAGSKSPSSPQRGGAARDEKGDPVIGANPNRRFSSASSRGLAAPGRRGAS